MPAGKAEIDETRLAGFVDEDVSRLDVLVDDTPAMGDGQGPC